MGIFRSESSNDKRKEQIIRCVKLGMDLRTSMYTVACSDEEMETLEKDEKFMRRVTVTGAILEMNLIESHDSAMDIQLAEGKTGAVQWKLERINPSRWGKATKDEGGDAPRVMIVEIPGLEKLMEERHEPDSDSSPLTPFSILQDEEDADSDD